MRKIIIDSQSNKLFHGSPLEQNYDQRGGLCEIADKNDIIITTEQIDPNYLSYWNNLGFTIPILFTAGPYNPQKILSDLIIDNYALRKEISNLITGDKSRLEFFCISETEEKLSKTLKISPYCNFDFSLIFELKSNFKLLCQELHIKTPRGTICKNSTDLLHFLSQSKNGNRYLLKKDYGTGGVACGGTQIITANSTFTNLNETVVVEEIVDFEKEIAIHWEIDENGKLNIIGLFEALSHNFGYNGTCTLTSISPLRKKNILDTLEKKLYPLFKNRGALGYFCCDILITKDQEYWVDFNPRKGAILYIHKMIQRMKKIHFQKKEVFFFHQHINIGKKCDIINLSTSLGEMVIPNSKKDWLIILTNPGIFQFGYADITAISSRSLIHAKEKFKQALLKLGL